MSNIYECPYLRFVLAFILIISIGHATGQITEKNYRIYSVQQGKEVTLQQIAKGMALYDVLFFGEEHNDSVTHYLESKMLEAMYAVYKDKLVLSLEMFERDVQGVMDEYLYDGIREKNFIKEARAWNNYKDYKPMVEFAKKNRLDVICANAPGRYTNLAGRMGQDALMALTTASKKNFAPLPYDTASGRYYEKLMGLTSHTAASPSKDTGVAKPPVMSPMGNFNLIMAQSLWDATMAFSIAEYMKKYKEVKVMQVNGRFHSDNGFAIVEQLVNYHPGLRPLIISSGTDESFPNIDWNKHKDLGDYIIITDPAIPRTYKD